MKQMETHAYRQTVRKTYRETWREERAKNMGLYRKGLQVYPQ